MDPVNKTCASVDSDLGRPVGFSFTNAFDFDRVYARTQQWPDAVSKKTAQ
jgi:hypothetical protein